MVSIFFVTPVSGFRVDLNVVNMVGTNGRKNIGGVCWSLRCSPPLFLIQTLVVT